MRRACVFLLLAFALLVCNGIVSAGQNAVVSRDSKHVARSLRTDVSDGDKNRRFLVAQATTEELTPEEEERKGGGKGGGGRGRSTSRSSTTRSRGSTRVRGPSVFSKIRNWFNEWRYKRWFKKGKSPEQVNSGLNLSNKKDKELSTGYVNYWNTRRIGYVPYYDPNGDHSKDK